MAFNIFKRKKLQTRKVAKHFNAKDAKLDKLKLIIVFVKKGHGIATNQLILENGASMSVSFFAQGSKEKYVLDIIGAEEKDKEGIIAVVSEKKYGKIKKALENRFDISNAANGILVAFDIKSMAGVLAYKFLTDYEGAEKYGKK